MKAIILCVLLAAGTVASLSAAPAEGDLFAEAESRYLGKNYTAALESYDAFLAAYPLSERIADVQFRRAASMYRLGKYKDAVTLLEDIEKRYRSTRYFAYVPLWKGLSLYGLGSYARSVESLETFLSTTRDPEFSPQALLQRSLALSALANDTAAIAGLRELASGYPSSRLYPYASVLLGSLLQKHGAFPELLELTQRVDPAAFPEPWKDEFLLLSAEALWAAGRTEEATPLYLRLVGGSDEVALVAYGRLFSAAQKRDDLAGMRDLTRAAEARFAGRTAVLSELWTRVGAESFRRGALEAAEPFLLRAWDVRQSVPVQEAVPVYLAELRLSRKDPAGARQYLQDFLAAGKPGTGAALIRLGDISLMAEDFAAAATSYAQFRSDFPDSRRAIEVGYLLAYCDFRRGNAGDSARLVEELLRQEPEPGIKQQLSKLRIVLLNRARRTAEAADSLAAYVAAYPGDLRSRLDYLKALFVLKRNPDIVTEADALRRQFPGLDTRDPYAAVVVSYLRGLALISAKEYRRAIADLSSIQPVAAQKSGLGVIVPYARYYLGWGYLRLGEFASAAAVFEDFVISFPQHELVSMVRYLAGWSRFSAGDFEKAAGFFSQLSTKGDTSELAQKSRYLYAKSLLNSKKSDAASAVFAEIAFQTPASAWAADALFDYAGALADMGQVRQAADAYRRLVDSFPDSPLREEASYRRADVFFAREMWAESRSAFDEYRSRYPKGKLVDAALYWGGLAAGSLGEAMAAALLWEQLISGYRESPLRGSALQKTAEAYAQARQYAKAQELFTRFIAEYPDQARAARADIRAEQVRLLAQGASDREAELSAVIARESGDKKRQATLELARLYIYSGDSRADAGYRLLLPLAKEGDPQAAAQAQALAGEYFYRKGDLAEAARQFLAAALVAKVDPQSAAFAIYRSAEMMSLAKKPDQVQALVKRLEASFPDSEWTAKARLLSGGAQ
jgi:TolA-binding protein